MLYSLEWHTTSNNCEGDLNLLQDLMKLYFHAIMLKPYYISLMNHGLNRAERYIETLHDITCRNLTGKENMAFVSITCVAQLAE